ncbi:Zn-ribbon domain-containing OB-fold protein [Actinomadura sp. SCN-SB]|uniref:Zn-ribbon domain-containing OB-fold protein n=1 Tax=Actinomadura sp. SCN-SB TaxID=3373092 RepID=UPI003752FA5B
MTRGVFPAGLRQSFADRHTQPFWDAARDGRLAAPKCDACGTFVLPPKPYCFECLGQDFTWTDLPGTGTIYTFTVVRHPLNPKLKDVVPYVSGVIELDGTQGAGARLMGNIFGADPDGVRIGDRVEVDFTPIGDDYAVMRFRHLGAAA